MLLHSSIQKDPSMLTMFQFARPRRTIMSMLLTLSSLLILFGQMSTNWISWWKNRRRINICQTKYSISNAIVATQVVIPVAQLNLKSILYLTTSIITDKNRLQKLTKNSKTTTTKVLNNLWIVNKCESKWTLVESISSKMTCFKPMIYLKYHQILTYQTSQRYQMNIWMILLMRISTKTIMFMIKTLI